ncbi:rhamnulokinase family protein [Galbitalea sp. SE-J8]|uniref:rhamnulokinase n=1 Tax=Galbitalea sp. SE-J8 TaxID=3054952 RepID=UPI00259D239B|nr:rhamnulokinase family protein [Galbitalea sp. SE-J8]MDM4763952.1 rhamnulokinase family protein [Galbitalea sp. SE-J8]
MAPSSAAVAAVDLGATSGRVILGRVADGRVQLDHVARFPNTPVRTLDGLHWNILELYRRVVAGLTDAVRAEPAIASVGIDSWAVDYALVRDGRMLGTPYHYRDARTEAAVPIVHDRVDAAALHARTGLQHLPFTTVFQLTADALAGTLALADRFLLIPDLIGYWLTGVPVAERTNASTTALLDPRTREWDLDLVRDLGLPTHVFPSLVDAGTTIGALTPASALEIGRTLDVVAVGSHDTASAVVAIPAADENFAYISCGTWGLVGVEVDAPILTEAGRLANFTNEGGVDGRIRYLHNVMGLWLLSESVREWECDGSTIDLPGLLAAAAAVTDAVPVFDADDPAFLAPGDMPARIAAWLTERGLRVPEGRAALTRCIVESLATTFARTVETAAELSRVRVDVVHLVGGGALNGLLCQLTADRTGRPVLAGPAEATAVGNVLVQARAAGLATGDLEALRAIVAASAGIRRYEPRVQRPTEL